MTNFDYIKMNLTELDLAVCVFPYYIKIKDQPSLFSEKIYDAWCKWAESTSTNHGNMAKGVHGSTVINENPSIWAWEEWHYPDGTRRKSGRNHTVSFLVWLSKQYDPNNWVDESQV